ncbi:MAG: membrane protein insertase YidC [Terracidiphilus sp.]
MPEIHNPNLQTQGSGGGGGGGDLRSTMALMLLVLAVFLGYQYFFAKPKPEQQAPPTAQTQPSTTAAQASPGQTQTAAPAQAPAVTPTISAPLETSITVENELYKIVLTNRGAQVKHWILKRYFDSAGKPLDLVQAQASEKFGLPLSLFTYEPSLTSQLNQALYQVTVEGAQPSATGLVLAPASITFHYAANGLDAVKTLRFDSSYVVAVEAQVKQNGAPIRALIEWPAGLGDMEEFRQTSMLSSSVRTPSYFAWSIDGRHDSLEARKVSGNDTLDEPYQYAAVMDLYFAAAFLPDVPERATVVTLHHAIDLPSNPGDPNSKLTPADVLGLAVGDASGYTRLRLFAGPKATDVLASVHAMEADGKENGPSLEPLIQLGWFSIIAKPLYLALRFLRRQLGPGEYNWGWAIILFTAIFTVVTLPLRFMSMKSSIRMMRLQPKIDAIKKRYSHLKATDPRRSEMNAEMMALHKQEGINPLGGCLPMLPQLPLFYAYYNVLRNAVELRQAHWFWLHDLSAADPYYILPGIIIVSMFLTQIITPSPGMDARTRFMMAIMMPVFMGFMFGHLASGLALYFCTSYVISLAFQLVINQSTMGKEMHAIAARRAAKSAGVNPKTIRGHR